ncbi:MAG: hypothetical protein AUH25_00900 [Thaumarchaeota archaeon 13_1_40CM_38_12]|nr:MAG: hypothetical protein AUH25_00900 [Thaumarchaeota archaeon 13_1_40CM_38_12]OLC34274.1 MAG: hypothetical protein AUH84_05335 [Thaumarchaeota archaeon 13_1_40CM_4_38_7]
MIDFLISYLKPHIVKRKNKERSRQSYESVMDISSDYQIDFKETMSKQISFIIGEIGELPNWFNKDAYIERCWSNYSTYLERNKEVKKYMVKLERRDVTNIEQKLDNFFLAIESIYESLLKLYPKLHTNAMKEFLDSDLPFEMFNVSNLAYLNRINAFDIIKQKTDAFQSSYHMRRGNTKKTQMAANDYDKYVQPIYLKLQRALEAEGLFKLYVKINNVKEMDEMFVLTPLSIKKMDATRFTYSLDYFREETYGLAEFLSSAYHKKIPSLNDTESMAMRGFRNDVGQILVNYG